MQMHATKDKLLGVVSSKQSMQSLYSNSYWQKLESDD
jgi:hypothetical protein